MAKRNERTDCHRPGAIIPAHYTQVMAFSLPGTFGGMHDPGYRWDCAYDRRPMRATEFGLVPEGPLGEHDPDGQCCTKRYQETHPELASFGHAGKCGVCGAHYREGVLFAHTSGDLVFMGHDCADKYEALYDASAAELDADRRHAAAAKYVQRKKNDDERTAFLSANPGLAEAFAAIESGKGQTAEGRACRAVYILEDLKARFVQWRSLSPKQVALAIKLAGEVLNPPPARVEPAKVPAPKTSERIELTGKIVHTKVVDGPYGSSLKMLLVVTTYEGEWKAWSTIPAALDRPEAGWLGLVVTLRAKLEVSRDDPSFAFLKRPTLVAAGFIAEAEPAAAVG